MNTHADTVPGPLGKTREFLNMITFKHTVFALPFAYLTMFVVARGWPSPGTFLWITLAMVSGRTFGMAANRLIDARIDARNPRTAGRSIPAGRMARGEVLLFVVLSAVVFAIAVMNLTPWSRRLAPVVLAAMVFYPYAKRFTWLSHMALGLVYFMIPTGVWIAMENRLTPEAIVLGLGAALWVAGFDIIYACQDVEVDRREHLHSMPADLGIEKALVVARVFHLVFFAALLTAGILLGGGALYYIGVALAGVLLAYEHRLVTPANLSRIDMAFFTTNGVISIVLFILIAADAVL